MKKIKSYKGFDKNLRCRDFQYEVGKDFKMDGDIEACARGFHACEFPFDVFKYYAPANSRYCEVEQSGKIDKNGDGSKVASSKIHINCEVGLKGIIEDGVKFIMDKVNFKDAKESNDEDRSAATNTGYQSAAKVSGKESIAIVTGKESKAAGAIGDWIVLTERGEWNGNTYTIKEVKAFKVDGEKIKADTFYKLVDGEPVESD